MFHSHIKYIIIDFYINTYYITKFQLHLSNQLIILLTLMIETQTHKDMIVEGSLIETND